MQLDSESSGEPPGVFKSLIHPPKPILFGALAIAFSTFVSYWPIFSTGFIWDDDDYVTRNQNLHDLAGLWRIWFDPTAIPQYYPLVHTTFWLEYHLWGLNPLGFHMVNVALHILAALLLWRVLAELKLPGAWLAAGIFALHPVQVESVAWITERKNVLSAVFYFSAALAYLRYAGLGSETDLDKQRRRCYFVALLLFVAALLCKTVTCSLPAALLLVHWWKKDRLRWADFRPLAPFFLVGLGFGFVTAWLERNHVGAQGADWSLTFAERSLIAGRALWFYAAKLIWPAQLTFIYPRWEINAVLWWQWLFPTAVLTLVTGLWLARKRIGKAALVAVLFYAGTLAPALGFVNVFPMRFTFVADHYQYLACVGLIALVAAGLSRFPKLVAVGLLIMLGCLTWKQAGTYETIETLWRTTLARNPQCWLADNDLGMVMVTQGKLAEAESLYRMALALKPNEERIHYNLANLLVKTGRLDEAIMQYQQALQLAPAHGDAHNNLGVVLFKLHRTNEAIAQFRQAIQVSPGQASCHYNLGNALVAERKLDAARTEFELALKLDPGLVSARNRLGALDAPLN